MDFHTLECRPLKAEINSTLMRSASLQKNKKKIDVRRDPD